jgi:long-chain-fatty-acid--[acyl-carrier-protein] ligase
MLTVIRFVVSLLLRLRYRIVLRGFDDLAPKDDRGILFLPNHPALIDPIILLSILTRRFRVGVLADQAQIDRPVIRRIARYLPVKAIRDPGRDRDAKTQIERLLRDIIDGLSQGQSFLLYPAGRIYRAKEEHLGSNSAVETVLAACPRIRVVLVRTTGLWGSAFSRASGEAPKVAPALRRGLLGLLGSFLFFAPRRTVVLTFAEPADLPRGAERHEINRYLERFYNQEVQGNTYIPYGIWERGGKRMLPEPEGARGTQRHVSVPKTTRALVEAHLREVTGAREIRDELRLAQDLGLDSLARVELQAYIEAEFGFPQSDGDSLETVADVLLAASGEGNVGLRDELKPVPERWFEARTKQRLVIGEEKTVSEAFMSAALRRPGAVVVADQNSGARRYRDLLTGLFVLVPELERIPGKYIGIMLPASVGATLAYLATLFAGKTPVMLNFTTGPRGIAHAVEQLGIQRILTARLLLQRLDSEGFGGAKDLSSKWYFLEDLAPSISLPRKLFAAFRARFFPRALVRSAPPEVAVVLFTSGSENLPKAVPLTHANLLTNLRDVLTKIVIKDDDALLAMLPPFHSFGLTIDVVLPLVTGLRVVFHSNPLESAKLAAIIEQYRASVLVGTPTFLSGIVGAARPGQLGALRLAVTGAEPCPPRVYDALAERCPGVVVIEGYGITECSPVVSANIPGRERRGTIGEVLPSVEAIIVDPDTLDAVPDGSRGLLLVRGPSVFGGYLGDAASSPFIEAQGKSWYRTGDLVKRDQGVLTFLGRLKRFVKVGGEMISLPAIEAVLQQAYPQDAEAGPNLAVECAPGDHPELVLFATFDADREVVNRQLRQAGLSPLHNVRRIHRVEAIPLLGTGKTDYRSLKSQLAEDAGAAPPSQ